MLLGSFLPPFWEAFWLHFWGHFLRSFFEGPRETGTLSHRGPGLTRELLAKAKSPKLRTVVLGKELLRLSRLSR